MSVDLDIIEIACFQDDLNFALFDRECWFTMKCSLKRFQFLPLSDDTKSVIQGFCKPDDTVMLTTTSGAELLTIRQRVDVATKKFIAAFTQEDNGRVAFIEELDKDTDPILRFLIYSPQDYVRFKVQQIVTENRVDANIYKIAEWKENVVHNPAAEIIIDVTNNVSIKFYRNLPPTEKLLIFGTAVTFFTIQRSKNSVRCVLWATILIMIACLIFVAFGLLSNWSFDNLDPSNVWPPQ